MPNDDKFLYGSTCRSTFYLQFSRHVLFKIKSGKRSTDPFGEMSRSNIPQWKIFHESSSFSLINDYKEKHGGILYDPFHSFNTLSVTYMETRDAFRATSSTFCESEVRVKLRSWMRRDVLLRIFPLRRLWAPNCIREWKNTWSQWVLGCFQSNKRSLLSICNFRCHASSSCIFEQSVLANHVILNCILQGVYD
jgi:hypothetical protein